MASSSSSDGAYGYSDQQQQYQGGYYGDAQQYQPAEFNSVPPPPGVDPGLQSGSSNEYLQGSPSGLAFPTDYGVGGGSPQGNPQQQQWQQPGGSSNPPVGSVYDDLDDW